MKFDYCENDPSMSGLSCEGEKQHMYMNFEIYDFILQITVLNSESELVVYEL